MLVALCCVLFAVSFKAGYIGALVCLFGASIGMAEVLLLSFVLQNSFDTKLKYLMMLCLAAGQLMFTFGMMQAGECLFFGVLLLGIVLIFRFVIYMNKYCRSDADDKLDETT